MTDLTTYSDKELYLIVWNNEILYRQKDRIPSLKFLIDRKFKYNQNQWNYLLNAIEDINLTDYEWEGKYSN
tara:strand:- start:575 stop:787 length:213 start_codon:yes stop_codon:yes gene_type:complete